MVDKTKKQKVSSNSFSFFSALFFVIALVASLASFGYQLFLESRINTKGVELEMFRQEIEQGKIGEFKALAQKIGAARELIDNHVSITNLFEYLESATLPNVQFKSLSYETGTEGITSAKLDGVAFDYATLALQSEIFSQGNMFNQFTFSGISLDSLGRILFSFEATVNKDKLLYFGRE